MSWGNDSNTLICEECGQEASPKEFVWVLDELPICKDGSACHHRQEVNQWVEARDRLKAKKQPWFNKLTTNLKTKRGA